MNKHAILIALTPFLICHGPALRADETGQNAALYFPSDGGKWETVDPESVGWNGERLQAALDYAGNNQSSGVVILYGGRILAERYFEVKGARSAKYRERVIGRDEFGGAIEDVASVQKSVASVLVGIAQQKGLLSINDRVTKHLGVGWSRATPAQEGEITIRHLITMSSGLTDRGQFQAKPGTKWRYNTAAYAKSIEVVAAAAKLDRHQLTEQWLTKPLGMSDSRWVRRGDPELQSVNSYGFATTPRDLARFGLMMLAEGKWNDTAVLSDADYFRQSTTTSQPMNPFYGYLWWLNHDQAASDGERRLPTAPADMFSANGALIRRCYVVPSMNLVVTRLGDNPTAGKGFDRQFWKLLSAAAP